jgi:pilus assembly protein CpaE
LPILLSKNPNSQSRIRLSTGIEFSLVTSLRQLQQAVAADPNTQLVLVDQDIELALACDVAESYRVQRPDIGVVVIREKVDMGLMRQALRSGVRELVPNSDAAALLAACKKSLEISGDIRRQSGIESVTKRGDVILVYSAKGGCGKTTVSINLADSISRQSGMKVALIDLDLQFGDVAVALQLPQNRSISDAIGKGKLDARDFEALMLPRTPSFHVLAAPPNPADVELISIDLIENLIQLARENYDVVIVDSPPAFTEVILRVFDLADLFIILTTPDVPAVKNLKVAISTLDALGLPRERRLTVVNRANATAGLSQRDIEKLIGTEIDFKIPESRQVAASTNLGKTVISEGRANRAARAFRRLSEAVRQRLASLSKSEAAQ